MAAEDFVLFCGVTIGSRLSRLLEELGPSARRYVSGEPFLAMREVGGKKVLGRPVQGGVPVVELEDFGRNVRSILRKIFPEERLPESDVRLFIVHKDAEPAVPEAREEAEAEEPGVPSEGAPEL
jgi:hypothetical protein